MHDWYANRTQNSWCWFSKFVDLGMSASHSPAIGDKPIELLTNTERCDFGHGFIIFGRSLIITKLYIARAFPVVKRFLRPWYIYIYIKPLPVSGLAQAHLEQGALGKDHLARDAGCHSYALIIIELVDSISRDGTDTPIYIQISKYLKIGNFVKFLSVNVRISSKLYNKTKIIHRSKQLLCNSGRVCMYGTLTIGCVWYAILWYIMHMLRMCCHGEVMWQCPDPWH